MTKSTFAGAKRLPDRELGFALVSTSRPPFSTFQFGIYLAGSAGKVPDLPVSYAELESMARDRLHPRAFAYVAGGAGSEDTMRANLEAFRAWRIVPRMYRDVSVRDLGTMILGTRMPAPVLLAPVGVQTVAHPDGELATARAAASLGLPMILSTLSSHTLEEVAQAAGDGPRWFQLYQPRDPELTASLVERAEAAGYTALVVTLDTRMLAWRPRDLTGGYLPFLHGEGIKNYLTDPVFRRRLDRPPEEDLPAAVAHWVATLADPSTTWENVAFLRRTTRLPILLKGVLDPEDARSAVAAGADGLVVSNHGGRQVDGAVAALEALPGVVEAVPADFPVLFDSGIRTGADIVKALALGARAVLVGRPFVWGLALDGEAGARHVLECLLAELDLTMALSGLSRPEEIGPAAVRRA